MLYHRHMSCNSLCWTRPFYFSPKITVFVIFPTFGQLQSRWKGINCCAVWQAHFRETFMELESPKESLGMSLLCISDSDQSYRQWRFRLVPRVPRSETRTLKLCRCGDPGIFSDMNSVKGREKGYRDLNTLSIEHIVGWTTWKTLPFCSKTLVLFRLHYDHVR